MHQTPPGGIAENSRSSPYKRQLLSAFHAGPAVLNMSYDDVEIEDMEWSEELSAFTYPCPCGDLFQITKVRTKDDFERTLVCDS